MDFYERDDLLDALSLRTSALADRFAKIDAYDNLILSAWETAYRIDDEERKLLHLIERVASEPLRNIIGAYRTWRSRIIKEYKQTNNLGDGDGDKPKVTPEAGEEDVARALAKAYAVANNTQQEFLRVFLPTGYLDAALKPKVHLIKTS